MFRTLICIASLVALPAFAQTAGDDLPSTENWWDRVGAGFFSDQGLTVLRPAHEIRAHWTALSSDDQAAVRERCAILADSAEGTDTTGVSVPSEQLGSNTGLGETQSDLLPEGDVVQLPADEGTQQPATAPDLNGDTTDQTSITGAVGGEEVHDPATGVQPYTGLAGGVTADDAQLRPVCGVIAGI